MEPHSSAKLVTATDLPEPPGAPGPLLPGGEPAGREPESGADDTQEVDVWWGAYAGRTMWPSFVVCGLLTGAIAVAAWHWWGTYNAHPNLARYTAYGLAATVWLIQLLRWGYRTVSMNYRVTNYRLFCDRGFRHPAAGSVELARITDVQAERNLLERLAGVGRLRVLTEDGSPPLLLEGVYDPDRIAALILRGANKARRLRAAPGWEPACPLQSAPSPGRD